MTFSPWRVHALQDTSKSNELFLEPKLSPCKKVDKNLFITSGVILLMWRSGATGLASDLLSTSYRFDFWLGPRLHNESGQVVHSLGPITKQYILVQVDGRQHFAAGKVTIGTASHWPHSTDFSGLTCATDHQPTFLASKNNSVGH